MKKLHFLGQGIRDRLPQGRDSLKIVLFLVCSWFSLGQGTQADYPDRISGEYLVKFQSQFFKLDDRTLEERLGLKIKSRVTPEIATIRRPLIERAEWVINTVRENPAVAAIEPNYLFYGLKAPNDPLFDLQWNMNNTGQAGGTPGIDISLLKAWEIEKGSRAIVVATTDTGILYSHPELAGNIWENEAEVNGEPGKDDDGNGFVDDSQGFDFANLDSDPLDDQNHGTHLAGIIGAAANNGIGIVGINQKVSLMALKFLSGDGGGSLENAIRAIDYARMMKAPIILAAWGGAGYSEILKGAIESSNALFVAAAGSDGTDIDQRPFYPAGYDLPNVIAVTAATNQGEIYTPSNYGKKRVHLAAPGTQIQSITLKGYHPYSGTSMAAAHVAGVAALTLAHEPTLTTLALKERLMRTALELPGLEEKVASGGMVNAYGAVTNSKPTLP